jgi:hypothetical protein
MFRLSALFILLAGLASAQIQILAQPQTIDATFKHLRLQRWLLRICNQDQVPRSMSDDAIYVAVPSIPFIPGPQAVEVLQQKQSETWQAKVAKYLGMAASGGAVTTVTGLVAASSPIKAGLVMAMAAAPMIQGYFQADVPSIGTLTENLLGYPAGTMLPIPAADSRESGCTRAFAYSPKFGKKNPAPPIVQGTIK